LVKSRSRQPRPCNNLISAMSKADCRATSTADKLESLTLVQLGRLNLAEPARGPFVRPLITFPPLRALHLLQTHLLTARGAHLPSGELSAVGTTPAAQAASSVQVKRCSSK
ncbi:hypothetical protein Vafri_11796, partial [Volvox africanus]